MKEKIYQPSNEEIIKRETNAFAKKLIRMYQEVTADKKDPILWEQCLRCGTSMGANFSDGVERHYHLSNSEFVAKLNKTLKEAYETKYWLNLLINTDYITWNMYEDISCECDDLIELIKDNINIY